MHDNNETNDDLFAESNLIYSYTRADMVRDGSLIEVSKELTEGMGFILPLGILSEVWDECVAWTEEDTKRQVYQEEAARLNDLLYMFWKAASEAIASTMFFEIACIPRDGKSREVKDIKLKGVIGPGDDVRPVLTVMFPEQD